MGLVLLIALIVIAILAIAACLKIRKNRGWTYRKYVDRYGEDFREEKRR